MACRRCSTCAINYPEVKRSACTACGGELNYFSDLEPHGFEEIVERIRNVVWRSTSDFVLYGGATRTEQYTKALDSLRGADDFLLECGDWPAPEGNDGKPEDPPEMGPPAPTLKPEQDPPTTPFPTEPTE